MNTWTMPNGTILTGVHDEELCHGRACAIHAPTQHSMSDFPLYWRIDRGIFERICPHGAGHPDPDQRDYWKESGRMHEGIHGCCGEGCCGLTQEDKTPPAAEASPGLGKFKRVMLGLGILGSYPDADISTGHDIIYAGNESATLSPQDVSYLEALGWLYSEPNDTWSIYV